jgi:hypothetical protein
VNRRPDFRRRAYFPESPFVFAPGKPVWFLVRRDENAAVYQIVLDYNECTGNGAPSADGG